MKRSSKEIRQDLACQLNELRIKQGKTIEKLSKLSKIRPVLLDRILTGKGDFALCCYIPIAAALNKK